MLQAVTQVERAERRYGDFTQTFRIPQARPSRRTPHCMPQRRGVHVGARIPLQEYERKWKHCSVTHGVLKMTFTQDTDEEGVPLDLQTSPPD